MNPLPPPTRPPKPEGAVKRWFGRTKRRLGYYELRNRLREPRFRRALRPTDAFLVGHPKSGNTWLAYMIALLQDEGRDREGTGPTGTTGPAGATGPSDAAGPPDASGPAEGAAATDAIGSPNLFNVGRYVPYVHGRDHEISAYEHLPDPRVFRNEYPQHRRLYPRILYVMRDPRAVLVSFWHMFRVMFDDRETDLGSFVGHYLSGSGPFTYWNKHLVRWDRQVRRTLAERAAGRAVHIVRYEDLIENRGAGMARAAEFLGLPDSGPRFERAVELGSFEAMRDIEDRFGAEAYRDRARGSGRFVRRGEAEGWREEMDAPVIERVERALGPTMREAGYL